MAGIGWGLAALCSSPMFGVFHQVVHADGSIRCENIFRNTPISHRQAWITYICLIVFFIPLAILIICYTRIILKVAQKANEHANKKTLRFKTGKVHLQSTQSASLPKAKIKTLKLTFAIVLVFIICSLPNFVIEMIMSYGDHCLVSEKVYAFFGGMAACNSAANPFLFLAFNVSSSWLRELGDRIFAAKKSPRYMYSATSSIESHYSVKHHGTHITQMTMS